MKVIKEYSKIDSDYGHAIALGNFDGIHIGHQELIKTLVKKSNSKKLRSCIYTFENHTKLIAKDSQPIKYIMDQEMKHKIFGNYGIDILYLDRFDRKLMEKGPREFVEDILIRVFNCKEIVVGFDYRFGYGAAGDIALLKELGKELGFAVNVVEAVKVNNKKVSSSLIRKYLLEGKIEKANNLLGRCFSLQGKVISGNARGRKLGYPTANLGLNQIQLLPKSGVYITRVIINDKAYMGCTSIGKKPTFGIYETSVETFILDYSMNLYNKWIEIHFIKKLRDEIKFESAQGLIQQIQQDVQKTKHYLQTKVNMLE